MTGSTAFSIRQVAWSTLHGNDLTGANSTDPSLGGVVTEKGERCIHGSCGGARESETLNVHALLDIDNIIERSVRAPSCDEHLRASTCLAANYLIGK